MCRAPKQSSTIRRFWKGRVWHTCVQGLVQQGCMKLWKVLVLLGLCATKRGINVSIAEICRLNNFARHVC